MPGIVNNPILTLSSGYFALHYILMPYTVDIFYMPNTAFKLLFLQGWTALIIPVNSHCVAFIHLMKSSKIEHNPAQLRVYLQNGPSIAIPSVQSQSSV